MPTLTEYYTNDFRGLNVSVDGEIKLQKRLPGQETLVDVLTIKRSARHDPNFGTRMLTFYIPKYDRILEPMMKIIESIEAQKSDASITEVVASFVGDMTIGEHSTVWSNRIYFYTECDLTTDELKSLEQLCYAKSIFVTVRGPEYLQKRMQIDKPLAFISHDSRDKDLIAKNIANGLNARLCTTWYDEYSLKVGQSLRESIEKGIKEAKKCILVITPNFLSNPGWTKKEFDSIFTREMIFNENLLLPVWFNVSKTSVYEYSPSLADKFALTWPDPSKNSQDDYKKEVEKLISKLHTEITT